MSHKKNMYHQSPGKKILTRIRRLIVMNWIRRFQHEVIGNSIGGLIWMHTTGFATESNCLAFSR